VTDISPPIELEEFEHVMATAGTALLRVRARRPSGSREVDQRPTLLTNDGETVHRFAPLAAPADPRGTLRAAYPVPIRLLGPRSTYALELSSGAVLELPAPIPGFGHVASLARRDRDRAAAVRLERQAQETAQKLADADATVAEAEQRATSSAVEAAALQTRVEALEHELSTANSVRSRTEAQLEHARDALRVMTYDRDELSRQVRAHDAVAVKARERASQAEDAHADVAAALRELETWPTELERRLTDRTTELEAMREARRTTQQEVERLRDALAQAGPQVEALRAGLEAAQASAHEANVEVIRLTAEAQARARAELELREAL
jgi:predicted  nucleic acid-binding Zn-ribbon protein